MKGEMCGIRGCVNTTYRHCVWCNTPLCKECWCPRHDVKPLAVDYALPARTKATPMKNAR